MPEAPNRSHTAVRRPAPKRVRVTPPESIIPAEVESGSAVSRWKRRMSFELPRRPWWSMSLWSNRKSELDRWLRYSRRFFLKSWTIVGFLDCLGKQIKQRVFQSKVKHEQRTGRSDHT